MSGQVVPLPEPNEASVFEFEPGTDPRLAAGFTMIPNTIMCDKRLSADEKLLYGLIQMHIWKGHTDAWPGQERLAKFLGVSVRKVQRDLRGLVGKGFVKVQRRGQGHTNHYTLVRPRPSTNDTTDLSCLDATDLSCLDATPLSSKTDEGEADKLKQTKEPSAPRAARRRGSSLPSSPAVSGRGKGTPKGTPTSVSLGLSDPTAKAVAQRLYDAVVKGGHPEISARGVHYVPKAAGAVYDLLNASHPSSVADIEASVAWGLGEGARRDITEPMALHRIIGAWREAKKNTRRTTHGSSHLGAGNDYDDARFAFEAGAN